MFPDRTDPIPPLEPSRRHGVDALVTEGEEGPSIVSISDIHGYLDAARNALTTLTDHPDFAPVVTRSDGELHWAGNDHVLVFNGDLVDRGPANAEVLALVSRLIEEAPPGRVRVTLGNHEAIALSPDHFGFSNWFSGQVGVGERRTLLERVVAGHVVAAYRGYNVTYAHAGSPEPYDVVRVNEALVKAAEELLEAIETMNDGRAQRRVVEKYPRVLGVGDRHPKGPAAGLVWLDFQFLGMDAPPQVVGHTRHDTPQRQGDVYCQNVIRNNVGSEGGEAVFVETPSELLALVREADGGVTRDTLARFDT